MNQFSQFLLTAALLYGLTFVLTEYRICSSPSCYTFLGSEGEVWHMHRKFPFQDGHYHLASISNQYSPSYFTFIEVADGRLSFDGSDHTSVSHPPLNQRFTIGPGCLSVKLRLVPFDDTHFYVCDADAALPGRAIAERCEGNCCNRQVEYFRYFEEAVDLPLHNSSPVSPPPPQLCIPLFLNEGTEHSRYASAENTFACEDIVGKVEQQLEKVPERMQQQLFIGLYADRNCTDAAIQNMTSLIRETGFTRYFRYTRSASTGPDFEVGGYWVSVD